MPKELDKPMTSNSNFDHDNDFANNPDYSSQETAESSPILPRSAWNSQLTQLRITLQAKQVLDHQENQFHQQSGY